MRWSGRGPGFVATEGEPPVADIAQLPLAYDRARYAGEAVAVVIAETAAQARDAVELVDIDYEPLRAVVNALDALAPDAPQLWDHDARQPLLRSCVRRRARPLRDAFAGAHLVVEREFFNQRIVTCAHGAARRDRIVRCGERRLHDRRRQPRRDEVPHVDRGRARASSQNACT